VGSVTNSALNSFNACPRKFHHQYNLKRVPVREAPALSFGRMAHEALEAWWKHGPAQAIELVKSLEMQPDEKAKLYAAIANYEPPFSPEACDEVITEQKFTMTLPDGTIFEGKADLIVVRKGVRILIEHKTTSEKIVGWGAYWQRLVMDSQLAIYAKALNCTQIYYDVIAKLQIRTKKDETPADFLARCIETTKAEHDEYYQFREIVRTDEEAQNAWNDVEQRAIMLAHNRSLDIWPRISTACRSIYGTCPYLEVCAGMAKIDDDNLFRTKEGAHEELA
jgi:PD-(D/E)XK nuclease superfamily